MNKVTPTEKQIKAVDNLVEQRGSRQSVSKAMRDAGYAEKTAKNPKNLTESAGFNQLCENAGLSDSFLLQELHKDIMDKLILLSFL